MKKIISHSLRIAAVAVAFGAAVSVAYAQSWTMPSGPFPAGNVDAPVNTGSIIQTKSADFKVEVAGPAEANLWADGNVYARRGYFYDIAASVRGRFGCVFLSCGTTATTSDVLLAGKYASGVMTNGARITDVGAVSLGRIVAGNVFPTAGLFVGDIAGQAINAFFGKLQISLTGTGPAGRNALSINVSNDNTTNGDGAVLETNADRFSLYSNGLLAALSAKKIRLSEGAGEGKLLVSDASGNASWQGGGNMTTGGLIRYVRSAVSSNEATATCASDEIAIAGGGDCEWGIKISQPSPTHSDNAGTTTPATGWKVSCLRKVGESGLGKNISGSDSGTGTVSGDARAEVICMKKDIGLATLTATSGNPTPSGPTHTASWHFISSIPDGNPGQSCKSWLDANDAAIEAQVAAGGGSSFTATTGSSGTMRSNGSNSNHYAMGTGYCAYAGTTSSGLTYCDNRSAGSPQTLVNYGNTVSLKPVKSCTGLDFTLDPAGNTTGDFFTQIYW